MWGKGWEELLDLLAVHDAAEAERSGIVDDRTAGVDGYGDGEALATV